jgi:rod shape-determining protein MreC
VNAFLTRNRRFLWAVVVILALVAVMSVTSRERERITAFERLLVDAALPAIRGVFEFGVDLRNWGAGVLESGRLREDNERLRNALGRLTSLESQLREVLAENERLREMLAFKEETSLTLLPARVIARNLDNWHQAIIINKGEADGVERNMPVVTSRGLVGKISRTTSHSATVMLLFDPDSGAGALVQRTRETGVVLSEPGSHFLRMKFFSRDASVTPGDVIVTSGLGGVYPRGLMVGEVVKVESGQFGLMKFADLRPAPEFDRLSEVFVLKGVK